MRSVDAPAWEAAGAQIATSAGPYPLGPGCWTSGEVPRLSFEKSGRPLDYFYREDRKLLHDDIEDDQSIIIHVEGKGLIVQAGCAHAGIVNTIKYGQEISGVDRVWAVLGGFHLTPAGTDEIQQTIDFIKALKPELVAPTHCTGFPAISEFARQMPESFVECVAGTTFEF
jgi:7,8-dihydropterin-6-yl-methyl-4-(beta-D-ribofuranosyl)aminobenzene 5'-phosphate synthase